MTIGHRVFRAIERPSSDLVARLAACDTADITDVMRQARTMRGIHPMFPSAGRIAGPAVTVSIPVGGTSLLKVAMDLCQPGDVLVVAARGATDFAMFGGKISVGLQRRGVAGLIVDGCVRDVAEIEAAGLPTFARGVAPGVPADGFGEVNVTVSCGGAVVAPGDIIVADANGVVAVPVAFAEEVLEKAAALQAKLNGWGPELERGEIPGIADILDQVAERGHVFSDNGQPA